MIGIPSASEDSAPLTSRAIWSDCLAYWEPRRLVYNGLLALVVLLQLQQNHWWADFLTGASLLRLVIAVALANLCYTTAHAIDLAIQHSDFRKFWLDMRGWLFAAGSVLGSVLACVFLPVFVLGHPWL
ncbi:MAG: hypothetical protein KF760_00470 [Candidatus Eremiobacteraeota bacterium]|nr:hypothetical protein [Candidatus Eremiobacteraeota bacterium]MCW5870964.1 hypothetical protein [Candidatus Eremiobacteraeota bacterium]